jgi:quinoprotein glucose dehydrogenase
MARLKPRHHALASALCLAGISLYAQSKDTPWPTYGGDPGGQRFTSSTQITPANVAQLQPAWTFHTGSVAKNRPGVKNSSFEATPILFNGLLYVSSPYDEIFALDPATGEQRWQFDPHLTHNMESGILTSRGVAAWSSGAKAAGPCATRIFIATMDARLLAVDARTGAPCAEFGHDGSVDLTRNVFYRNGDAYFSSSPPTVIGNLVVVGSGIVDNQRVDIESGVVRAFDCVTGKQVWSWDPIPWAKDQKLRTGAANAWSVIAADPEHGLIFVPTGAASPDFYGGMRPGDDRDANSVVALDAATGSRVWGFQVVHHDLWDYDVAAEPLLFTFRNSVPAIAITTKQGLIFVLNRLTGEPLYPIVERPVPASDIPGEQASRTQPFQQIPALSPTTLDLNAKLGSSPQDDADCHRIFASLRYEGIYTPPSYQGTLAFPGNLGGVNWGGAAIDPATGVLYANTNRYAFSIQFFKRHPTLLDRLRQHMRGERFVPAVVALAAVLVVLLAGMVARKSLLPGWRSLLAAAAVLLLARAYLHRLDAAVPPLPAHST